MLVIDTRSNLEYQSGHVSDALNLPPERFMGGKFPAELADIPKDEEIIVYCRSGARSNVVRHILSQHGFTHLTNGISQAHVEKLLHK